MSDLRAHRGVFMTEALYWYALNVKEAVSFNAHGFLGLLLGKSLANV
jgi:hypothetical protein